MRCKRFVQTEQLSITTSKQIFLTPRLSSEINELFDVTLFQLMGWANSSQMQYSKGFKSGLFAGHVSLSINNGKCWQHQSCVSWWVCGIPLFCWKFWLFQIYCFRIVEQQIVLPWWWSRVPFASRTRSTTPSNHMANHTITFSENVPCCFFHLSDLLPLY